MKRLKYLGVAIIGLTYDPAEVVGEGKGTLVLRSSNVQDGSIVFDDNVYVSTPIPEDLVTQVGDILICSRNGSRALIGKNALINETAAGSTFGAFMTVFRSKHNDYLAKVFNSQLFEYQSGAFLTSTINQLTVGVLNNFEVPVPPALERSLIAEFLDRETGKIDALVKKKERLIELLHEKRTALISHAVTQGLNPNAPKKDSGIPWLGHIPKHWECGRLKVRLNKIGQGWSPLCENRPAQEGEWGVLKVGCMNGCIYDEAENKALPIEIEPAKELEIRVGDVLMSRSNTVELVGSVGIVHETQGKILLCDKLFRLVFDQTKLLPEYAVSLLRSPVARKQIEAASSGASPSMKNISNGAVSGLVLPFPPVDEQQVILKRISDQTAKLDALMAKVRTAIERLQEYRTALISAAVTGQIDVRSVSTL